MRFCVLLKAVEQYLELCVRVDEALDFVQCVNDEHVYQVLPCPVQPVVEGGGPLGELKMHRVNPLKDLLSLVHAHTPLLGQGAQTVPLIANLLAPEKQFGLPYRQAFFGVVQSFLDVAHFGT